MSMGTTSQWLRLAAGWAACATPCAQTRHCSLASVQASDVVCKPVQQQGSAVPTQQLATYKARCYDGGSWTADARTAGIEVRTRTRGPIQLPSRCTY